MPNILLTQKCIRSCPYCFARKHMHDAPPEDILKWEDLIYIADFFQGGGDNNISLLGGEPMLHPEIVDFILYIIGRGLHVTVFTSGIASERILNQCIDKLSDIDPRMLTFVVNYNDPATSSFADNEAVNKFFLHLSQFVSLSINVYKLKFDYTFALNVINKYGLHRHIRLGLAHPIPGKKNMCIKPEDMRQMAIELMEFIPKFEAFDIHVGFDCGIPMCIFTDEEIGRLYKHMGGRISFGCGPAVDIGPDLQTWACFPLSGYGKKSLLEFSSPGELLDYFNSIHNSARVEVGGIYEDCDSCQNRLKGLCSGGCLSHSLNKFINEAHIRDEKVYSDATLDNAAKKQ